ncbi:MAG: hypothetical protein IJT00_02125 [Lachnospiraceae bacterium]|nr:hypothetical protein [Lachnospiraceae bacterium]
MSTLLVIKQNVKMFVGRWQMVLVPLLKFLLSLLTLTVVNSTLGYMGRLKSFPLVLVAALLCSFMPWGFTAFVAVAFVVLHMYALSMECALVMGAVFLLFYLLFSRFASRDQLAVILTPLCFYFHVPFAVPVTAGLLGNPGTAVSVGIGTAGWYMIRFVSMNEDLLSSLSDQEINQRVRTLIDGVMGNRDMRVLFIAFSLTVLAVTLIRRLSTDHAWTIAIVAGSVIEILSVLVLDIMFNGSFSVFAVIAGTLAGTAAGFVVEFFCFNLDYARQEKLQFEDDDYYYYVKAVPKMAVAVPEKRVRRINRHRREENYAEDYAEGYYEGYGENGSEQQ